MTLTRKLSIATAGATAILSVLSVPVSAFTIAGSTSGNLLAGIENLDPGAVGTVIMNDLGPSYLVPPTAGSTLFTRFIAEAPTQFPNWTIVSGAALGGILTINEYNARGDYGVSTPVGGANMKATYTRATTDPTIADLRFIQLFTDNTGDNGGIVSHIDPFPNHDILPWYYTDALHTMFSTPTSMIFQDYPSDPVNSIPFNRTVNFETYLATFDNTTKVATIRDGWGWGYNINAHAVPEPLTILASATALGFGAFFKKEVSKKPKKN